MRLRAPGERESEQLRAVRREIQTRALRQAQVAWRERALRWKTPGAFAAFVKLCWNIVEPRQLDWAPYLDVVCDALHRQMLGEEEYRRLLINLPPGYAKSLLVSVFAPAYEWLFDPTRRKLFFAGDDVVTRRDSRRTRILITSELYLELLGELCRRESRAPWRLSRDQNEKDNFENDARGFRACLTLNTRVTGKRGDDLVVDDPIDVKAIILGGPDAVTARCHEARSIIDQALESRVNDRRDARRTLIMQRLHPLDPAGHALAEGGWRVLCFPIRFDPDHPQRCPDDRRAPGELLHPTRDTDDDVAKLEAKLGWQAAGQLYQRPTAPGGQRIKREWFRSRYSCRPEDIAETAEEVWISSDAAVKAGQGSDYHSIQVWARKDRMFYLLDRLCERMGYPEYERSMAAVYARWRPWIVRTRGGVLVEDAANGSIYLQTHVGTVDGLIGFRATRDTPGTDKSKGARAMYLERAAEAGQVVLPEPSIAMWIGRLEDCWVHFPGGAHDDDVDAASQLLMRWMVRDSVPDFFL